MTDAAKTTTTAASGTDKRTCFVVMPMSDVEGYAVGHWDRVYEELLEPACTQAGFTPDRADTRKATAIIMADVLVRLHKADMVLCDMSALRPNVMFELGLRQAFDLPVVIVHDGTLDRPFDLAALRDFTYDSSLRVDLVRGATAAFAAVIKETYEKRESGEFSLVRLLEISKALPPKPASEDAMQRAILASIERLTADVQTLRRQASFPQVVGPTIPLGTAALSTLTTQIVGQPSNVGLFGTSAAAYPSGGLLHVNSPDNHAKKPGS